MDDGLGTRLQTKLASNHYGGWFRWRSFSIRNQRTYSLLKRFPTLPVCCLSGELDRSTLAEWVGGTTRTLRPLVDALQKCVLSVKALHGNAPVPVLERASRKRGGCGPTFASTGHRGMKHGGGMLRLRPRRALRARAAHAVADLSVRQMLSEWNWDLRGLRLRSAVQLCDQPLDCCVHFPSTNCPWVVHAVGGG